MSAAEAEKIVLSKFDESNTEEHIMKLLMGLGIQAAFRGSKEHTLLSIQQFSKGVYPSDFEDPALAGRDYISIDYMNNADKTHKLTVNNSYSRNTGPQWRFPVLPEDPNSLGASIERYLNKCHPHQDRFYCKPIDCEATIEALTRQGLPHVRLYHKRPMGPQKIKEMFTKAGEKLGLDPNWVAHSLRGVCITKMVNDNAVSLAETMRVSRHSSVAASKTYQTVDGRSEANRMRALGVIPKDLAPLPLAGTPEGDSKPPAKKVCVSSSLSPFPDPPFSSPPNLSSTVTPSTTLKSPFDAPLSNPGISPSSMSSSPIVWSGRTSGRVSDVSMTQDGISDLKSELDDLKGLFARKTQKPVLSENQLAIMELRREVMRLTGLVKKMRSEEDLYVDNIVEKHELEKTALQRRLNKADIRVRRLEKENGELLSHIERLNGAKFKHFHRYNKF